MAALRIRNFPSRGFSPYRPDQVVLDSLGNLDTFRIGRIS
jgi:hypothetical protein